MENIIVSILAIPVLGISAFVIGRLMGWGWAKSWFEAKRKHEKGDQT